MEKLSKEQILYLTEKLMKWQNTHEKLFLFKLIYSLLSVPTVFGTGVAFLSEQKLNFTEELNSSLKSKLQT